MKKVLIITEKLSTACKLAANAPFLGSFYVNNTVLTDDYLTKNETKVYAFVNKTHTLENDRYIISYASGHLAELYQASDYNPIYKNWENIPDNFYPEEFRFKVKKGQQKLFNHLKKLMNSPKVDYIICGTDADREGENIFALIYYLSGCQKKVKRLWLDSYTPDKIKHAFQNIKDWKEYQGLRDAGYSRMIADWVLGALLTAHTTVKLGKGDIISVGRVQTAVLNEIVRREIEIKNFKTKKYYVITAKFKTNQNEVYEGELLDYKFDNKQKAQNFLNTLYRYTTGIVREYRESEEREQSPLLYDQTSLQVDGSKYLNFSPDKTLAISQNLYEKGYLTYPRTASRYLTKSDYKDFVVTINNLKSLYSCANQHPVMLQNKRLFDDTKVDSHIAIIPTTKIPNLSQMTPDEQKLYDLVAKRSIAINFPPAVYKNQYAITVVDEFKFSSTGKIEIAKGWKEIYNFNENFVSLPFLKKNATVNILSFSIKEKRINPPPRYTEASILQFMESCGKKIENEEIRELMKDKGIGTSATRAEIIKRLKEVGYIEIKKKVIYPTEKGLKFIEIFPIDELKNAEFTGEMEYKLKEIEKGKLKKEDFMKFLKKLYFECLQKLKSKK